MHQIEETQDSHGSVRWHRDSQGVVTVVLDDAAARTNMITDAHVDGMAALLDHLESTIDRVAGVVVTSAKESLFSGPEFELSASPQESGSPYGHLVEVRSQLRRLERLGRPVAAVLNGSALGGGFEIALACHHRIGVDLPDVRWALAERTMGILPAGGGTVRATRMLGLATAVRETLGGGAAYSPTWALARGLVDELAPTAAAAEEAARRWVITAGPHGGGQRWERDDWTPPGGRPGTPSFDLELAALRAELDALPADPTLAARHEILGVGLTALSVPADQAFEAETAAFLRLVALPSTAAAAAVFGCLKRIRDRAERGGAASEVGIRGAEMRTFAVRHANPLVDVFLPTSPKQVVEVRLGADATDAETCAAVAQAVPYGIPIVVRDGGDSPLHRLVIGEDVDAGRFADGLEAALAAELLRGRR